MNHKKLLSTAFLATSLLISFNAQAEGWQILPVLQPAYKPDFAAALVIGGMQADDDDNSKDTFTPAGLEISLNCPLLKAPNHTIRQQISYVQSDKDGFKTQAFELSPQHMYKISNKVTAGFGPSIGYTKVENSAGDDGVFTLGFGVSTRYDITNKVFIGAEARYVKAQELDIDGKKTGFDNARALVKLGYQF